MISEDAVNCKPVFKKRMLVGAALALAAIGTHWLPARSIVAMQAEQPRAAVATASADKAMGGKLLTGPNSLLGDAVADQSAQAVAIGTDCSTDHLDLGSVVDQAGLSRFLNSVAPVSGESMDLNAANVQASAVPEPRMAGLLLLAAAPMFVRRKSRA